MPNTDLTWVSFSAHSKRLSYQSVRVSRRRAGHWGCREQRFTVVRDRCPSTNSPVQRPARALCEAEREHVLDVLAAPRFVDRSPGDVAATLLDEGEYLCSERTMYRVLV